MQRKRKTLMMKEYELKKFMRTQKKFIRGVVGVIFSIIGVSATILLFSFFEDTETVKIVSAATSILVIIDLYDTIQQYR